ncbi:YdgH/BhsA/McbA-like domain containing protein [Erwinia aphidicola]|uniref:YdgH/BhsA/McbA-like domain containing protein n=1 Tax=Erwinia TaxID=551 RepID=UPI001746C9B5|nr:MULTISPECIES: YdgH/BhsA/McbA-like domain containing protein [Erwinia]MBD1374736.1 DUF1471 domain-containing protein [Erwinia aphidicola]MBD1377289.1 DUF1471 domain-containing protein [Erwinia aphidicola]MDI3440878.1 DUF1471 domain-containing protein [Erwinia sp. V90_4]
MMLKTKLATAAVLLFSLNAYSAELMTKVDFDKVSLQYEKVGDISVADESSTIDAREALKAEAEKLGADIYVITSANEKKKVRATAVAYKKK